MIDYQFPFPKDLIVLEFILWAILIFFLFLGKRSKAIWKKQVLYSLSALFFGLAISEAYLTYSEYKRIWSRSHYRYMSAQTDSVHVIDSSVGYIINQRTKTLNHIGLKNKGIFGLDTFFNVRQSISKNHRNAGAACDTCLNKAVFVGCSFTYGHGLIDEETLPYMFNQKTKNYSVLNLGVMGYGTNNVVKLIEDSLSPANLASKSFVFYTFIPDHINRSTGRRVNLPGWPIYSLDGENLHYDNVASEAKYTSFYSDLAALRERYNSSWIPHEIRFIKFARRIFLRKHQSRGPSKTQLSQDQRLNNFMLKRICEISQNKGYMPIILITIDKHTASQSAETIAFLEKSGIKYYLIQEFILDYTRTIDKYVLNIQSDLHPNKNYNDIVSDSLVSILGR